MADPISNVVHQLTPPTSKTDRELESMANDVLEAFTIWGISDKDQERFARKILEKIVARNAAN